MTDYFLERSCAPVEKKEQLQRYARICMSEKLKDNGFVSYAGEDLSWYKLINGEVLLTVYVTTDFRFFPVLPMFGFGLHPLYIEPLLPQRGSGLTRPNDEVMIKVFADGPVTQFPGALVQCPATKEYGAEILDDVIFPAFSQIESAHDAYLYHKNRYLSNARKFHTYVDVTLHFVDMALFYRDTEMYTHCLYPVKRFQNIDLGIYWKKADVDLNNLRYAALTNDGRDAHLAMLEARKKKIIRKLEKRLSIKI